MEAVAESWRIREYVRIGLLLCERRGTRLSNLSRETQLSGANGDEKVNVVCVQLTTSISVIEKQKICLLYPVDALSPPSNARTFPIFIQYLLSVRQHQYYCNCIQIFSLNNYNSEQLTIAGRNEE